MKQFDWKDAVTRVALVSAGVIAALIFTKQGQAEILPALALGGVLGACFVTRFNSDEA